jgi:nicotinate-nucleotide adenylyltransferase
VAEKVGVFGGSFSPLHLGHLLVAREAQERLGLDEILFMPCARSANNKNLLPSALRLRLLRAALRGQKKFRLDARELKRGGVSRSIDSLRELKAERPKDKFFLLIGQDQASDFPRWKEAEELARLCQVVVLGRPGYAKNADIHRKYHFETVKVSQYEISSTQIRARLKKNLSIEWFVPQQLLRFLSKQPKQ